MSNPTAGRPALVWTRFSYKYYKLEGEIKNYKKQFVWYLKRLQKLNKQIGHKFVTR